MNSIIIYKVNLKDNDTYKNLLNFIDKLNLYNKIKILF